MTSLMNRAWVNFWIFYLMVACLFSAKLLFVCFIGQHSALIFKWWTIVYGYVSGILSTLYTGKSIFCLKKFSSWVLVSFVSWAPILTIWPAFLLNHYGLDLVPIFELLAFLRRLCFRDMDSERFPLSIPASDTIEVTFHGHSLIAPYFFDPVFYRKFQLEVVGGHHNLGHSRRWPINNRVIGRRDFDH